MDKIYFFKDRGDLVATIQGFVTKTVINGMRERGFRYDKDTGVYRAPYSESAESYLSFLEKVCRDKIETKGQIKQSYLELFNEGLSVLEIASRRKVKEVTVYKNLVKEVEKGSLDYRRLISDVRFQKIYEYLVNKDTSFLKPLKENAPFDIEYWELELVLLLMKINGNTPRL